MAKLSKSAGVLRFGVFEVDLRAGELRKDGLKVRLQEQPFRVLALLLEKPGDVVTRDELREKLWSADTYVDFDKSLNTTVNKLREALEDSAENPRFVQTLHRRGYRFIAPVGGIAQGSPAVGQADLAQGGTPAEAPPARQSHLWFSQRLLQLVISALVMLAVGIIVGMWVGRPGDPGQPADASLLRFAFTPGGDARNPVISPNGRHIAYMVGESPNSKLWVQDLDRDAPREIEGTEGVDYRNNGIFWSPDSDFIGFSTQQGVKKVPVEGGPVALLCQLSGLPTGGAWSPDGDSIIFGVFAKGFYEVPARGGEAEPLFETEGIAETGEFAYPHFLPLTKGPRMLLFHAGSSESQIVLRSLDTDYQEILADGRRPVYSPSGHIVYQASDSGAGLWALPFSIDSLKSTGPAFPIAQNAQFASIAANGTLAYLDPSRGMFQFVWRNRQGEKLEVIGQPQEYMNYAALSPDGRRVATIGGQGGNFDIWLHDTARPIKVPLTNNRADRGGGARPMWSPSGDQVAFNAAGNIFRKSADGRDEATPLLATPAREYATDWSLDGKYILYLRSDDANSGRELWYLRRKEDGSGYESVPFLQESFNVEGAQFSPDGRFVAYLSDESGAQELWVAPFPSGDGRLQISIDGARQPLWSRDGKEIFYVEGRTLVAVAVTTKPDFSVGSATRLFPSDYFRAADWHHYDVSADGQRFVVVDRVEDAGPPAIRVVQNWYEEFRDHEQD